MSDLNETTTAPFDLNAEELEVAKELGIDPAILTTATKVLFADPDAMAEFEKAQELVSQPNVQAALELVSVTRKLAEVALLTLFNDTSDSSTDMQ